LCCISLICSRCEVACVCVCVYHFVLCCISLICSRSYPARKSEGGIGQCILYVLVLQHTSTHCNTHSVCCSPATQHRCRQHSKCKTHETRQHQTTEATTLMQPCQKGANDRSFKHLCKRGRPFHAVPRRRRWTTVPAPPSTCPCTLVFWLHTFASTRLTRQ